MVNLGDVSLFATAYYIFAEIEREGFPARMLPGVTSVAAVAARLGQSLTEMEQPLHILPASCDLDVALALPGTKVLRNPAPPSTRPLQRWGARVC